MKYIVCAVRDRVADVYNLPYCAQNKGAVIRSFADEVNRAAEDNMLYRHAEDFELFLLGEFESDTGVFTLLDRPQSLILGGDCRQRPESPAQLRTVS